jgi:hypothetical protein
MSGETIAAVGDFLQAILSFLQGGLGPFGLAQTVFTLAGLWALWRIRQPLRAARDDLQRRARRARLGGRDAPRR